MAKRHRQRVEVISAAAREAKRRRDLLATDQPTPDGTAPTSEEQARAVAVAEMNPEDIITINIGRPGQLADLRDFRVEMMRIYRLACEGRIPVSLATKAVWIVDRGRIAKLEEEKLELVRERGGVGDPFTGLEITPPPEAKS